MSSHKRDQGSGGRTRAWSRSPVRKTHVRPPSTPAAIRRSTQRRSTPARGRLELWHARTRPDDVVYATRPPFDPGSPKPRRASDNHGVLRGGVLEPGALAL